MGNRSVSNSSLPDVTSPDLGEMEAQSVRIRRALAEIVESLRLIDDKLNRLIQIIDVR